MSSEGILALLAVIVLILIVWITVDERRIRELRKLIFRLEDKKDFRKEGGSGA